MLGAVLALRRALLRRAHAKLTVGALDALNALDVSSQAVRQISQQLL